MRGRRRQWKKCIFGTVKHQQDKRLETCPDCGDWVSGWATFVERKGEYYEVDEAIFCNNDECRHSKDPHTIREWLALWGVIKMARKCGRRKQSRSYGRKAA
jgi:hypothetical protein